MKKIQYFAILSGFIVSAIGYLIDDFDTAEFCLLILTFTLGALVTACQKDTI
jgi:hypothetical protein